MDACGKFAVLFLMAVGVNEAALAQGQYAPAAQYGQPYYGQPYVYAAPPGWGLGPGAVIGAGMGALAGGSLGSAVAGSVIGAAMGAVATTPPVYPAYPAPVAYVPAYVPAPAAYSSPPPRGSADAFISNWQSFMQPSTRR